MLWSRSLQGFDLSQGLWLHSYSSLQVPIVVPIIVLVFSIFLVIAPIVDNPKLEYAYSIAFMIFGATLYVPFVKYKLRLPFIGELIKENIKHDETGGKNLRRNDDNI